jgi:hypothetical protein
VICVIYVDDCLFFAPNAEEEIQNSIQMIKDQGIVVEVEDSVGWCILRNLNVESC